MKRILLTLLVLPVFAFAQIGIGTNTPEVTLDVVEATPAAPTASAGIGVPQVDVLPSSGNRSGQLVLLTTNNKLYYYNGTSWVLTTTNSWNSAGAVTFTAISATRAAGTAPTVDPNAIMNLREWKLCDDGYIEETIIITSSSGTVGTSGSGYYIITPQFNIDTSKHVPYSKVLNVNLGNIENTYGANIGSGIISHNGSHSNAFAIPISTDQIAIGSRTVDVFVSNSAYTMNGAFWQLKLTIKYKRAP